MDGIVTAVREAGVVGAGGAGFPTHVKLQAEGIDTVIANGVECEPLLRCDKARMLETPALVLEGLVHLARATGARRAVVALKGHYPKAADAMRRAATGFPQVELVELDNFYPAGDEQVVVHEVTGRIVPEGGIPLQVGCVISNVITLAQVARAARSAEPVTARAFTVVGDVARPRTLSLPIGTSFGDALRMAGGATVDDPVFIEGGPMMGTLSDDPGQPLTKRSSGLLVLSESHALVRRRRIPIGREVRMGRSVCCQCRMCTDLCPRFLLGHALQPHLVMRAINHAPVAIGVEAPAALSSAWLCCLCGVCEAYACPLGLSPRRVYESLRASMAAAGVANPHHRPIEAPRPMRAQRRVPAERLIARLGLTPYRAQGWDIDLTTQAISRVRLPLSQHIGAPAEPVVRVGDRVVRGALVGEIPAGALGARVHASISGRVTGLEGGVVEICGGGT